MSKSLMASSMRALKRKEALSWEMRMIEHHMYFFYTIFVYNDSQKRHSYAGTKVVVET